VLLESRLFGAWVCYAGGWSGIVRSLRAGCFSGADLIGQWIGHTALRTNKAPITVNSQELVTCFKRYGCIEVSGNLIFGANVSARSANRCIPVPPIDH